MSRSLRLAYLALIPLLAMVLPSGAQVVTPAPSTTSGSSASAPPSAPPETITLTELAEQALATEKLVQQLATLAAQPLDFEVLSDKLTMTRKAISTLQAQSSELMSDKKSTLEKIRANQTQWKFVKTQLIQDQEKLRQRSLDLENGIAQLTIQEERWQKIKSQLQEAPDLDYDDADVKKSTNSLSNTRKMLTTPLQEALTLDKEWQELIDITDQEQMALKSSESYLRNNLFTNIQTPIWQLDDSDFSIQDSAAQSTRIQLKLTRHYFSQYAYRTILIFTVTTGIILFIWRLRVRSKQTQEKQVGISLRLPLIDRPVSTIIGVSLALALLLYPYPPQLIKSILTLLLFIPVTRLGLSRLPKIMRPLAWLVSIFFVINTMSTLTEAIPALQRLWMLGSATVGLTVCIHALIKLSTLDGHNSFLWRLLRLSIWLAMAAALIAIGGSIFGALTLAQFLITGVAYSAYAGLCVVVLAGIINDLAVAAIYMPASASSRLISHNRPLIVKNIGKLTTIACSLIWIHFTLDQFALWDSLTEAAWKTLGQKLTIGSISVSLSDIFSVTITIWLSFKIAQLLRFILIEDIAPRAQWARGVPEAISTLTQYCIVLAGFMTAISVAGIDMSKLTIMAGALGVGIGIGLQDVVNNFTSGLILLFEQKIKQADIIQCSNINGKVTHIGMRCSVVRTFDGAEVIVPNGQLVSSQVINWTHSDQERRISIPIGVAYGTDPQLAIDTLIKAARENTDILTEPAPVAFFVRFGPSSMDFELRAWVNNGEIINEINSRLCIAICNLFKEADIEIPFPQQEVHVRGRG